MKTFARSLLFFIIALLGSCVKDTIVSPAAQLKSDTTLISEFIKENKIPAIKLAAGVWYVIDSVGVGVFPVVADSVVLSYAARKLPDLSIVDSMATTTVALSTAIAGMKLTLPLFPVGSFGRIYVPSGLAFGSYAHNTIPPNSNLCYRVHLTTTKGTQLTNDKATISAYLTAIADSLKLSGINLYTDPVSGISYTIKKLGTGATPRYTDSVQVSFQGNLLNMPDSVFAKTDAPVTLALRNQMAAWKIILPFIPSDTSVATIFVPSGYGYGSTAQTHIPANANLVYQVNLIKVIRH